VGKTIPNLDLTLDRSSFEQQNKRRKKGEINNFFIAMVYLVLE
jgi:hypothetical protein